MSDAGGVYTGSAFAASRVGHGRGRPARHHSADFTFDYMETDVSPHVDMGSTAPSDVGSYTVTATYNGDLDHSISTSSPATTFSITPATSTTTVSDAGGVYTGSPFTASALATGAGGLHDTTAADFTFDYVNTDTSTDLHAVAPTNVGHYSVTATYTGDANHSGSTSSPATTFSITLASSTTTVSDPSGAFTGSPFVASAQATGAGGLNDTNSADFTFDYVNTDTILDLGPTAPTNVGDYSVTATYNGDANHSGSTSSPATFSIGTVAEELQDQGFESPALGTGTYVLDPTGSPWTYSGGAGVTNNQSPFTSGNPNAPEGTQVALIQKIGSIRQSISMEAGTYVINFEAAQRGNFGVSAETFQVLVDGSVVGTFNNLSGTAYTPLSTPIFSVTAGVHTLTFLGTNMNGGDNTVFLDQVSVDQPPTGPVDPGFESPALGTGVGTFVADPTGSPWTFSGGAGVTNNQSPFTSGDPNAPQGNQVAFLQKIGTISQSVVFTAGSFVIDFEAAQRSNFGASSETFQVLVDATVVGTFNNLGATTYSQLSTTIFTATAGLHTVTFQGTNINGGDNTVFLDEVSVVQPPVGVIDPGFESPALGTGAGTFVFDPTGSPWTFSGGAGVTNNQSPYTSGNPNAPQGTQVAFLQRIGSISQSVFLDAGAYVINFEAAQRGNFGTSAQTFQVLVDGNVVGIFNNVGGTAYTPLSTSIFTATAGLHTVIFEGTNVSGGDNTIFIDQVATAQQPADLLDPGFESPALGTGAGTFASDPTGSPWTFSGAAGVTNNQSPYTSGNANAPQGSQVAFIQNIGSVSQNVFFSAGTYVINFEAAQRGNFGTSAETFQVLVDGAPVGTFNTVGGTAYRPLSTNSFTVTAGLHTVTFEGTGLNVGDNTIFIDQVAIALPPAGPTLAALFLGANGNGSSGAVTVAASNSASTSPETRAINGQSEVGALLSQVFASYGQTGGAADSPAASLLLAELSADDMLNDRIDALFSGRS